MILAALAAFGAVVAPEPDDRQLEQFTELAVSARTLAEADPRQAVRRWLDLADPARKHPWAALGWLRAAQFHQVVFAEPEPARMLYGKVLGLEAKDRFVERLQEISRRWLARLYLAAVEEALNRYYADRVRYPRTLAELVEVGLLKPEALKDPWGEALEYSALPSVLFPDQPEQEYRLTARRLGASPASARQAFDRQNFLEKQMQVVAVAEGEADRLKTRLLFDPHDGVHKKQTLTAEPGAKVLELEVARLTRRCLVLLGDDAVVVLAVPLRPPSILTPPKPKRPGL